jgi:hypothetical protein
MMRDFIARTNWSNIESNYFVHTIIIFDLSYYTNIMMTVTFVNHPMLCHVFFFFSPKYYLHKSCTIFDIDLYILSINVGAKTRKSPLPVMDMLVCVLGSVRILAFLGDPLLELYYTTGYQFAQITSSSNALERGGTILVLA